MHDVQELPPISGKYFRERGTPVVRISPFVWLNLVCLDAPIVAVTWQLLFARSFHVPLSMAERAALFLTAWLIYLTDRFADVLHLSPADSQSLRQRFCRDHWPGWIAACVLIAALDLWIISRALDRETIRVGIFVGTISLVYLAVNYWLGKAWRFLPIKEICVGSLFAAGGLAVLFMRHESSSQFLITFVLFAALCSLNCISIAIWERDLDLGQRKNSIATRWAGARTFLRPAAILIVILAVALGTRTTLSVYVCIGASALMLAMLDLLGEKIWRDERTALADLVLLTPLILIAFGVA